MNFIKLTLLSSSAMIFFSCATNKIEFNKNKADSVVSSSAIFCEEEEKYENFDADQLILCKKMYQQRPYIRPPQDNSPFVITNKKSEVTIYGGLYRSPAFGLFLVDRFGRNFKIMKSSDKPNSKLQAILKKIKYPSNRILFTLYQVNGSAKKSKEDYDIELNDIKPVLQLTGEAIDGHFSGTSWEGGYYQRDQTFTYKLQSSLRVKITGISALESVGLRKLAEWASEPKIEDADVYSIDGIVENLEKSVIASDGKTCLKALNKSGVRNPFVGAIDPKISVHRMGAMHIAGDSVVVFEYPKKKDNQPPDNITPNGMDGENRLLNVINFLQVKFDENQPWSFLNIRPHSANKNHLVKLRPVEGKDEGGEVCE